MSGSPAESTATFAPSRRLLVRLSGWLWWTVLPVRKGVAVSNYRRAFPERSPTELRRGVGELVAGYWDGAWDRGFEIEGLAELPPGAIVLTGHTGAIDRTALSFCLHREMACFVRMPTGGLARWWIDRKRRRYPNGTALPPSGSKDAGYQALREGKALWYPLDQRHNRGIPVPFFGRPAWTSPAFAAAVHRTRAPLYGLWTWTDVSGTTRGRLEPLDWEIPEDREVAIRELTEKSQQWFEEKIRTAPWGWLWMHKRWKEGDQAPSDR